MSRKNNNPSNFRILPWTTAIFMVIGIAVLAALYWNRIVTVDEVDVTGITFTPENEIIERAGVTPGIKPDSLDLDAVILRVESMNYIKKVVPYIEPSGDLRLDITERQPLALLVNGSDRVYVDAEGVKLEILEGKTLDLPLVYGFSARSMQDTLNTEAFRQIRDFLLQAKTNRFGWATISEVAFDKEEGVVALSHENGVKLVFGRDDFQNKLENWQAFYAEVIKTKGIQSMRQVDLRFRDQVVTRES